MNKLLGKIEVLKNIGLIIGIPFLIGLGVKMYNLQVNTMEKQITFLKETQYDKALSVIKGQTEVFQIEREYYENKQNIINVLVNDINKEHDPKKKTSLIKRLRVELDQSFNEQIELNERLSVENNEFLKNNKKYADIVYSLLNKKSEINLDLKKLIKSKIFLLNMSQREEFKNDKCWKIIMPIEERYTISSPFVRREVLANGKIGVHLGVDIATDRGEPVYAAQRGTVTKSFSNGGYGNYVEIEHDETHSSSYSHLSARLVTKGNTVVVGELIGLVGNTGRSTFPHLHFELYENKKIKDPLLYINCPD